MFVCRNKARAVGLLANPTCGGNGAGRPPSATNYASNYPTRVRHASDTPH